MATRYAARREVDKQAGHNAAMPIVVHDTPKWSVCMSSASCRTSTGVNWLVQLIGFEDSMKSRADGLLACSSACDDIQPSVERKDSDTCALLAWWILCNLHDYLA